MTAPSLVRSHAGRVTARRFRARRSWAYLFLAPAFIVYTLFAVWPALNAFRVALYEWPGVGPLRNFVGLDNFRQVFAGVEFWRGLLHNAEFFAGTMVINTTLAIGLALLLYNRIPGHRIYQTVYFMPAIISLVATGMIWKVLLDPNIGLVNVALRRLGLDALTRPWLGDPAVLLPLLILVNSWQFIGTSIIIFLAGLLGISEEVFDAAKIDGADSWATFRYVTWPLLAPAYTIVTVLTFIGTFMIVDIVYVMAGIAGGVDRAADVTALMAYRQAFGFMTYTAPAKGIGTAVGIVSFIIIAVGTGLLLYFLRRREADL